MTIPPWLVTQHPASADAYIRHGWSLVPIPAGTKGPQHRGWNLPEAALRTGTVLPQGCGFGLAHAYSGTMAVDVDDYPTARFMLGLHGIDLDALFNAPDAVWIRSGRPGHEKLLYRMPFGAVFPSKKVTYQGSAVYDLRCGTSNGLTVQDVLPPSVHPDTGQPYQWGGNGRWDRLPTIPSALLAHWQDLLKEPEPTPKGLQSAPGTTWTDIHRALEYIRPDCSRDEWITVGMALHLFGAEQDQLEQAMEVWDAWSQPSIKYQGRRDIVTQWRSFRDDKSNRVTLGSLFHLAEREGWKPPTVDVTELFKAVEPMEPDELLSGLEVEPPDPELELWPSILTDMAKEVAVGVGCDPLVPLWAGLGAVCAVVDARSRLELVPGFQVPPVLWVCTVGDPADKKTPGSRPMLRPLDRLCAEDAGRYAQAYLEWEGRDAAYAAAKKAYLDYCSSSEGMLDPNGAPPVPPLPERPAPLRLTVQDVTSQKLVRQAADRPQGLLCSLDEMASWVKKLTDPRSGEDRSCWVRSYEAQRYEMDRVGSGTIIAENLAVSVFGNIQPRVLRATLDALSEDGLIQRFIPAILRGNYTKRGNPTSNPANAERWEQTLRLIMSLPTMTYRLDEGAYQAFRAFQAWYEQTKQDERLLRSPETFMGALGKLEGTCGRLALLMHIIESPFSNVVSADLMRRAIRIIQTYVVPAYRHLFSESGESFDRWVVNQVIQYSDVDELTMTDIKRNARKRLVGVSVWDQDQMVLLSMRLLEKAHWVKRLDKGEGEHRHKASWAINPEIQTRFKKHRQRVVEARQRQIDYMYRLSTKPTRPRAHGAEILESG